MPWANRKSRTRGAYHILFRSVEMHRYRYSLLHFYQRENETLFHIFFVHFKYHSSFFCPIRVRRVHIQGAPNTLFPNSNLLLKFKQTITIPIPCHSVYVARPTQRVFIKFPFSFSRNYDQFSQLIA